MIMRTVLIAGLTLLIGACSNPQGANEVNFSEALQDYLNHREVSGDYCIGRGPYPYVAQGYTWIRHLEEVGLVVVVGERTRNMFREKIYNLTATGRQLFNEDRGFCYGKPVLVRINSFSEPESVAGRTVSEVNYEYRLDNVPEWAIELSRTISGGDRFYTSVRDRINSAADPLRERDILILTNHGWIHERLFSQ